MGGDDAFEIEIRKQVQLAIDEADVILFLVDAKEGLTPMDEDVAVMLRRCPKKVLLVAHLCGDFFWQCKGFCEKKRDENYRGWRVCVHMLWLFGLLVVLKEAPAASLR